MGKVSDSQAFVNPSDSIEDCRIEHVEDALLEGVCEARLCQVKTSEPDPLLPLVRHREGVGGTVLAEPSGTLRPFAVVVDDADELRQWLRPRGDDAVRTGVPLERGDRVLPLLPEPMPR